MSGKKFNHTKEESLDNYNEKSHETEYIKENFLYKKENKKTKKQINEIFNDQSNEAKENLCHSTAEINNSGETEYTDDGRPNFLKIPKKDAKKAAKEYGEGCKSLTKFLEVCILNGIQTTSSCAGHPEKDKNYSCVDFDISGEKAKKLVEYIIDNKLADSIRIRKLKKGFSKEKYILTVYVDINKRDNLYNICTENIKKIIGKEKIDETKNKSLIRKLIAAEEEYIIKEPIIAYGNIEYDIQKEYIKIDEQDLRIKVINQLWDTDKLDLLFDPD